MGVYTKNTLDLSGSAEIQGDIFTTSIKQNSITLSGGSSISGNILVPTGIDKNIITNKDNYREKYAAKIKNYSGTLDFPLPDFPDIFHLTPIA